MGPIFSYNPGYKKSGIGESLGMAGQTGVGLLQQWNKHQQDAAFSNELFKDPTMAAAFKSQTPEVQLKVKELLLKKEKDDISKITVKENYETLKKTFGGPFAKLHGALTRGGQTILMQMARETLGRKENLGKFLSSLNPEDIEERARALEANGQMDANGEINADQNNEMQNMGQMAQPGSPQMAQPGSPQMAQPGSPQMAQPVQPEVGQMGQPIAAPQTQPIVKPKQPGIVPQIQPDAMGYKYPQMEGQELPEDFEWPNFKERPAGKTQKEWVEEMKGWRSENVKIFQANKGDLKNTKEQLLATKALRNLNESKKLPSGLGKMLIDPQTGELRKSAKILELGGPAAEQWAKEIGKFKNRAKTAYGSRITNFDLETYMLQFPDLLNSEEGRRRIINMMDVNYKLDHLGENALDKIFKRYGLNDIPQEKADELMQGLIEEKTKSLQKEYLYLSQGKEYVTHFPQKGNNKGDKIEQEETGRKWVFDGQSWIEL